MPPISSIRSDTAIDARNSGATPIDAPFRVDGEQSVSWDDHCDVLVVGFGAAGACAAIEAADAGADVIVTDRFGGGGASAKSGGVVYAGGGTRFQKTAGYDDSPDAMYEYLLHGSRRCGLFRDAARLLRSSVEMIKSLEAHSVEFDSTVPPCKTSYPADGYYLYFSGNETVKQYTGKYPPAPRGHRVKGAGLSGAMLFRALRKSVHASGARVMTQSSVRRLVIDNNSGAVLGAELWQFEKDSSAARRHRRLSRWAERMYYPTPGLSDMLRRRALECRIAEAHALIPRARRRDPQHRRIHLQSRDGRAPRAELFAQLPPRQPQDATAAASASANPSAQIRAPRARLGMAVHQSTARMGARNDRRHNRRPLLQRRGLRRETRLRNVRASQRQSLAGDRFVDPPRRSPRSALRRPVGISKRPRPRPDLRRRKAQPLDQDLARRIGADPAVFVQNWRTYNDAAHTGDDPSASRATCSIPSTRRRSMPSTSQPTSASSLRRAHPGRPPRRRNRRQCENPRRQQRFPASTPPAAPPSESFESLCKRTRARGLHLVGPPRRPLRSSSDNAKRKTAKATQKATA